MSCHPKLMCLELRTALFKGRCICHARKKTATARGDRTTASVPHQREIAAEEALLNEPLYQALRPRVLELVDRLQRATTTEEWVYLHRDLLIEFGARQDASDETLPQARQRVRADIRELAQRNPKPLDEIRAQHAASSGGIVTLRLPTVTAARKRGVIRVDLYLLENARVRRLNDTEFRVYLTLLSWIARNSENTDGEVPAPWLDPFCFGATPSGWPRRLTPKVLARLLQLGLLEEWEYDDGTRSIVVVGWRDFRPVDMTSAERKRRHRRRKYGAAYYGTEGDVMEVELRSAEEVAAIEAEGRTVLDEIQRRGVAAVLGEIAVDPYPGAESRNPARFRRRRRDRRASSADHDARER